MALKIDVKFEGKLTCAFKINMKNLANFHKLKNRNSITAWKMAELNQYVCTYILNIYQNN